jgi:hypothetical protein
MPNRSKIAIKIILVLTASLYAVFFWHYKTINIEPYILEVPEKPVWEARSIDTMKYSRDRARLLPINQETEGLIGGQIKRIAEAGATHAAISTPYDPEFWPYLKLWVSAARENGLKVHFRGNMSGWENWFGYKSISKEEHLAGIEYFILSNPDFFADGDIFCPCTECENGGPGDPRETGDIEGFRRFILDLKDISDRSFGQIGKEAITDHFSFNGAVADLAHEDPEFSARLGGLMTVDHYDADPEKLASDIVYWSEKYDLDIAVGEIGAPVPGIHPAMSEEEQAEWLEKVLALLSQNPRVRSVNYWTNAGGETALWSEDGNALAAVSVLEKYFQKMAP